MSACRHVPTAQQQLRRHAAACGGMRRHAAACGGMRRHAAAAAANAAPFWLRHARTRVEASGDCARLPLRVHYGDEVVVVGVDALVLLLLHERDGGGVARGHEVLHLLAREDVDGDEVAFGVAVLAGLGGGDIRHLAWVSLDHDVASLADLSRLTRVCSGCAGVGGFEGLLAIIRHVRTCDEGECAHRSAWPQSLPRNNAPPPRHADVQRELGGGRQQRMAARLSLLGLCGLWTRTGARDPTPN